MIPLFFISDTLVRPVWLGIVIVHMASNWRSTVTATKPGEFVAKPEFVACNSQASFSILTFCFSFSAVYL